MMFNFLSSASSSKAGQFWWAGKRVRHDSHVSGTHILCKCKWLVILWHPPCRSGEHRVAVLGWMLGKPLPALCDGGTSISVENGWSHLRLIISQWIPAGGKMYTQGKSVNTNLICMEKVAVISCDRKSFWATPTLRVTLPSPISLSNADIKPLCMSKAAIEKFFSLFHSKLQNGFSGVTV